MNGALKETQDLLAERTDELERLRRVNAQMLEALNATLAVFPYAALWVALTVDLAEDKEPIIIIKRKIEAAIAAATGDGE